MSLVQALDLERVYGVGTGAVTALGGVSITIDRGQLTALRGRSGSGKTTLINLLGGLDRPTGGKVIFDEIELSSMAEPNLTRLRRKRIGYVFQSFALLPLLSAKENVELPLRIAGMKAGERRERADRWLSYVGLGPRAKHRPFELSGGEQQRVALARALAIQPDLILADEPTGQLDSRTAAQIIELLLKIARETGVAICITTHDPAITELADRVYTLADGRLVKELDS